MKKLLLKILFYMAYCSIKLSKKIGYDTVISIKGIPYQYLSGNIEVVYDGISKYYRVCFLDKKLILSTKINIFNFLK